MRMPVAAALAAGLTFFGCARQAKLESGGEVALGSTPVDARSLPSGTTLEARLDRQIGTETSRVGDHFTATIQDAVIAQNGAVVVPAGAIIDGQVTGLQKSGHVGEPAVIKIDFDRLTMNGRSYPLRAQVTATAPETSGGDTRSETLRKAGVGAAAGAVLGAVLGGGDLDKILLGGAIGAAAGTAISLGTGDVQAVLPAGTRLTLQTTQTIALR